MASLTKQQTYRLLMKKEKAKTSTINKISHPLAKYNTNDQLTCIICNVAIKSEILWQTHLQSRNHKENVASLKSSSNNTTTAQSRDGGMLAKKKEEKLTASSHPLKRKRPHQSETNEQDHQTLTSNEVETDDSTIETSSQPVPLNSEGLPSDFFDTPSGAPTDGNHNETEDQQKNKEGPTPVTGDLPEGFFDDPKRDAKVRKVEFKDPLDDQWEEFQKTISKESEKSEAIVEVGDEEMKEDREVSEVKEQVYCYERAEKLRIKQEKIAKCIVKSEVPPNIKEESNSSDDEADLEDLLDWRFKS